MNRVTLGARGILALWLVLMGIVYGLSALGQTDSVPSIEWERMFFAIIGIKVGLLIAEAGFPRSPRT